MSFPSKIGYPIDMNGNAINNPVFQRLASAPASPVAGQYYVNTTDGLLYKRNEANTAWENLGEAATYSGNKTISGYLKVNEIFTEEPVVFTTINIYVDPVLGNNTLAKELYLQAGNYFQTLEAAIKWRNQFSGKMVTINIQNTSVGSPLLVNTETWSLTGNSITEIRGASAGSPAYITQSVFGTFRDTHVTMRFVNWTANIGTAFQLNRAVFSVNGACNFTLGATCSYLIDFKNSSQAIIVGVNGANSIIFGANNQAICYSAGTPGINDFMIGNTASVTYTVAAYTGLRLAAPLTSTFNGTGVRVYFYHTASLPPAAIDLSDCEIHYGGSLALRQTASDANSANYAANLGGTKPLRFTNINSGSADGTYTTKKKLVVNELGEVIPVTDSGAENAVTIGDIVDGATAKTTLVDADKITISDSAASGDIKSWSFANLKIQILSYISSAIKTLTNTTIDANGTGNSITNLETADFAANVVDNDSTLAANSSTRLPTQQAVKGYVDGKVQGVAWKDSVRVATVANGTLATAFANGQVVDGVTLVTGDRIALKNQTTASENGIYVVQASGAPVRASDADTAAELKQATFMVQEGTVNADTQWTVTNNGTIVVGTTGLTFGQIGNGTVPDATTATAGKVYLATSAEAKAKANVGNKAVDPTALADFTYAPAATNFGNGTLTQFDFTHSFSEVTNVEITENATGLIWGFLVTKTSATNVRVNCATAPTTNQFKIVISGK